MSHVSFISWSTHVLFHFRCSAFYHHGCRERHTGYFYTEREARPARCAVGLVERELEHHRHLDDLLPSHAHASPNTGDAPPRDVQNVYKRRHDVHRVCRTPFHP